MTGLEFEKYILAVLQRQGYWAHRLTPDNRGAQPFDIIAVKDDKVYAYDCKVISTKKLRFQFSRIEENQKTAMQYFSEINLTSEVAFLVWCCGNVYKIPWILTTIEKSILLKDDLIWRIE